jgi:hypothetical protein
MNPGTSKARTNESLAADLDRASALIGQGTTSAHSHGLIMLDELEKLERQGLLAAGSPFLVSDEFLEIESDLLSLADALRLRFPDFIRRVEAFFNRVAPPKQMSRRLKTC